MRKLQRHRHAIRAAIFGVIITLAATLGLRIADDQSVQKQLSQELTNLQLEIRRELQLHLFGFSWISQSDAQQQNWLNNGPEIFNYYRHFRHLFWLNQQGEISAIYPSESETATHVSAETLTWLQRFNHGIRYLVPAGQLSEHPADLLLVIPQHDTPAVGYYAATINMHQLFSFIALTHLAENTEFQVKRVDDEQLLFSHIRSYQLREEWGHTQPFQLFGETWEFELWPSPQRLDALRSNLPILVFVAGILVTCLLTFVLYLLGISRVREKLLKDANRELYDEIEEREKVEKRIAYLAEHDPLTGLANRNAILAQLERQLQIKQANAKHIGLMMIDLDHFKEVNDTLGHNIGNLLLKQVSKRISEVISSPSILARLGGDEFAILVPIVHSQLDLEKFAEEIIHSLDQQFNLEGYEVFVTASIGIALTQTGDEDGETLMRHADTALHRAKQKGRNTWHVYSQELHDELASRLEISKRLRHAIEHEKLTLYYQPQVDMTTRKIIGLEVLVRWIEDDGTIIGPDQFIPIAEDSGLILPISDFVLQNACKQLGRWRQQGYTDLRISVNLSGRQFQTPDLTKQILFAIRNAGIPAAYVELELTEQVLIENQESHTQFMHDMREHGITLAIDDFGVGYSSLSYLKHFPINALKIDRSFVKDIPEDKDDATITQTIISLAHNLDIGIVAEGVETEEQAQFLIERGCTIAQGFYYSKPLPVDEITQLLSQSNGVIPAKIS